VETQKEHRVVARQCWEHIKTHFPDIAEAVEDAEL
jgi:thymidylate synthase ThyX